VAAPASVSQSDAREPLAGQRLRVTDRARGILRAGQRVPTQQPLPDTAVRRDPPDFLSVQMVSPLKGSLLEAFSVSKTVGQNF
jgi:hypothetical protein